MHAATCALSALQLSLLHCICNPSKPLRQTVGTSIAVIVSLGTLKTWPELISACVQGLEGSDLNALEGCLDALYKVGVTCKSAVTTPDFVSVVLLHHVQRRSKHCCCFEVL